MFQPLNRVVAGLAFVVALSVSVVGLQEGPVYQVDDPGVTPPRVVKEVRPRYSPDAMRARVQGVVELKTVVSEKGAPTNIRVTKPLDEGLDREAVQALEKWVFEPGRRNGDPVRVEVTVSLSFRLE
jgi:protein TonB